MSAETDEIRDIAEDLSPRAEMIFAWIAGGENEEDKARTLADNEVLPRLAGKLRDVADYFDAIESGEIVPPDA